MKNVSIIERIMILIICLFLIANSSGSVFAAQRNEVSLNGSVYNDEAEYYQYCLNYLGYTDYDNTKLDTDGYFGDKTTSALNKFLRAAGFSYFNIYAKNTLMSLAENSPDRIYSSGFTSGAFKLSSTAFIYSDVSNIDNSNDPFYSINVLKNFKYIITTRPDAISYKSKRILKVIQTTTKVFGYVNLGPDNPNASKSKWKLANLNNLKSEIASIAEAGWYGIFVDQFGYDYKETRERQNIVVDYAHSKGLKVMVNSWFPEDALGSRIVKSSNPAGAVSHLNSADWYLIESFFTGSDSYSGDSSFIEKYLKVKQYRNTMKINVATLSYKRDSTSWQQATNDVKTSYILAHCLGFNGWWFGKTNCNDDLSYGKDPNVDLGAIVKQLKLKSNNKYIAETENYVIEYYAQTVPVLKLTKKN